MFQRDYFMRMIGQMSEAMGQVMGLRSQRKQEEALLVIDDLLEKQFRLNARLLRGLADDDLIALMTTNGIPEQENLQAVALLFKEEADIYEEMGNETQAYQLRLRSLHLFMRLSLMGSEPALADPAAETDKLLERLAAYELPAATKELLTKWLEDQGRFDQAENMLYERLEDGVSEAGEAEDFYRRLLLHDDAKLEAGGVSREEIVQGLGDILRTAAEGKAL
ncbi:DUF6483 family protein [Paenibacillus beijingensis]|uniref:Tetratricopeptide repeat protein n=1 Tax=Paenibacillus beijingensis TaxID=1126833 RepID=A0A0D5NK10_9BACL|nr:DUF6483 family protein [Paenibacillus beijingensis]AJY75674.1 hypothetical protein VN24_15315 [Paenibacillus beijingensis]